MSYPEFRASTLGINGGRNFKVRNSYGTKQAWRWIKKNKWLDIEQPISEHDFGIIVKSLNLALRDQLLEGHDIVLPLNMGKIELRKYNARIKFEDGKLKTNLPINWDRTLKLWYDDPESKANKTLVRQEPKQLFTIFYNKKRADYNNKSFYQFTPIREFRKELSTKIKNNEIDAFLMSEYELY